MKGGNCLIFLIRTLSAARKAFPECKNRAKRFFAETFCSVCKKPLRIIISSKTFSGVQK
ncbi:Uncharacterized protein dnm_054050 [Desulfonema magnum]|uniref:Uncharacterized protein n=1 Tax=Desulfonema magnum TaxID=45655 RepID=A0A975GPZ7_9BACT|nr:Uncharacterized protein dnm_054050 [Desulfonema magnum]